MKPRWWWAIGGGVAAGVVLLATRREQQTMYGETKQTPVAVPDGWRRATNAEVAALPELAHQAVELRNSIGFTALPYGTLNPFTASNGQTYATWVEQHYHEPGGPVKPWGYHHGVTVLAAKEKT